MTTPTPTPTLTLRAALDLAIGLLRADACEASEWRDDETGGIAPNPKREARSRAAAALLQAAVDRLGAEVPGATIEAVADQELLKGRINATEADRLIAVTLGETKPVPPPPAGALAGIDAGIAVTDGKR